MHVPGWLMAVGWVLVLALGGCGSSCSNSYGPILDICPRPGAATVDRIEVADTHAGIDQGVFPAPLMAGDPVRRVRGVQGADMIVLRLGLHGPQVPDCIDTQLAVTTESGDPISRTQAALSIYKTTKNGPSGSGPTTGDILLPGHYDEAGIIVTATAGGTTVRLPLKLRIFGCIDVDSCVARCGSYPLCESGCTEQRDPGSVALFQTLNRCLQQACGDPAPQADGGSSDLGPSSLDGGTPDGGADAGTSGDVFRCLPGDPLCSDCIRNAQSSASLCAQGSPSPPGCGACASEATACFND